MTLQEAEAKYLRESYFHALVDWMAYKVGVSFTRDELTWAAVLACGISLKREIEDVRKRPRGADVPCIVEGREGLS